MTPRHCPSCYTTHYAPQPITSHVPPHDPLQVAAGYSCPTVVTKANWLVDDSSDASFSVTQSDTTLTVQRSPTRRRRTHAHSLYTRLYKGSMPTSFRTKVRATILQNKGPTEQRSVPLSYRTKVRATIIQNKGPCHYHTEQRSVPLSYRTKVRATILQNRGPCYYHTEQRSVPLSFRPPHHRTLVPRSSDSIIVAVRVHARMRMRACALLRTSVHACERVGMGARMV